MVDCENEGGEAGSEVYIALLYEKNKLGVALYDAVSTDMQIGEFYAFRDDIFTILERSI
jgi:hypothetical protein